MCSLICVTCTSAQSIIIYHPVRAQRTTVEEAGIRNSECKTSQPQTFHWRLHRHCSTSQRSTSFSLKCINIAVMQFLMILVSKD